VSKASDRFIKFVENNFGEQVFKAVQHYCICHRELLEERLNIVGKRLSFVSLEDLRYRDVFISNAGDSRIEFDLLVEPELAARMKYDGDYYEEEPLSGFWLSVSCAAIVREDGFKDFRITNVDEYSRAIFKRPVSGDLVPFIKKCDYGKAAEDILHRFYPESLMTPMPIDPLILARKMGLNVINRSISEDGSVFGEFFFSASKAYFFNRPEGKSLQEDVAANTIVVDENVNSVYSFGCKNITVAHECVHAALHKEAFIFAKALDKSFNAIECLSDGKMKGSQDDDTVLWMERQANGIAPYLLMPNRTFLIKANDLIRLYSGFPDYDPLVYTERIIRDLSDFFGVTVYSARKRLIDLGFEDAIGCLNWIKDDHAFARSYLFKKGVLPAGETFTVDFKDIYKSVFENSKLLQGFASGRLVFVENHVCLNDPKYCVKSLFGELRLTEYARRHLDECCLRFKIVAFNRPEETQLASACYLCRDCGQGFDFCIELSDGTGPLDSPQAKKDFEAFHDEQSKMMKLSGEPLSQLLSDIIEMRHIEVKELSDASGISERQIGRYTNGKFSHATKRTLIALCHGLRLYPKVAEMVLKQGGFTLADGSREDEAFEAVLIGMREDTIENVNRFLIQLGVGPLSEEE
jgi:DNA-binding Xre family transcriptional regulator